MLTTGNMDFNDMIFNPALLEEDEIQYEVDIRPEPSGQTPHGG